MAKFSRKLNGKRATDENRKRKLRTIPQPDWKNNEVRSWNSPRVNAEIAS